MTRLSAIVFLLVFGFISQPLLGQRVMYDTPNALIPAAVLKKDGTLRTLARRLTIEADSIAIGDTLLLQIRPLNKDYKPRITVKYCYQNCDDALDENTKAGYVVKTYSADTVRPGVPVKLILSDRSEFKDDEGNPLFFDNTQLRKIFIEIRNYQLTDVRFDAWVAVARSGSGEGAFPLPARKQKPSLNTGRFHAVLIGMSQYADASLNLKRPSGDLLRLDSVLRSQYDFATITRLTDPDKKTVKDKLMDLSYRLMDDDNLLIFFAGHAANINGNGYWALRDTRQGDVDSFLSTASLTAILSEMYARHVLVIVDACFGSRLVTRDATLNTGLQTWQELYLSKSRKAMSSSANEEAPDQSVFVDYLVKRLAENGEPYLSAQELFDSIKVAVHSKSANHQRPVYGNIYRLSSGVGDFIFKRKMGISQETVRQTE